MEACTFLNSVEKAEAAGTSRTALFVRTLEINKGSGVVVYTLDASTWEAAAGEPL